MRALSPNDFSLDDFRFKEQNTLTPTIKILVVSNKKLPGGGLGSRLGALGLWPHFSENVLALSCSLSWLHLHAGSKIAATCPDFIHKLQDPEKEKGPASPWVSFL